MESEEEIAFATAQVAAVTMAQIAADRERLPLLWAGLNQTELVIRRGQLAYLESTALLGRDEGGISTRS